jgi:hypothetical protein
MSDAVIDTYGLVHEIAIVETTNESCHVTARCGATFFLRIDGKNLGSRDAMVTCIQCLGTPDKAPRRADDLGDCVVAGRHHFNTLKGGDSEDIDD